MNFKQSFRLAIKSLRTSKMRSFLTMLGIIIGVASVIVLVSLMNGLSKDMTSQFESMGTNTLTVNIMGRGTNRSYSINDMENLIDDNSDYFTGYSPVVSASITMKYGSKSVDTTAKGVNELYDDMQTVGISEGRFIQYIDAERRQKVCVIGTYIVSEIFDGADALGKTVKVNGSSYTVVGVMSKIADSTADSSDDIVYIPYSTATRLSSNAVISSYMVSCKDTDHIDECMAIIETALNKVFTSSDYYRVTSMSEMIDTVNTMMSSISAVLVGIAGISLMVGGIGIMNIMLVSVTERTREIGIRKSLGAKRKDIMRQFIIEAATTSSVGGLIGIAAGFILSYVASIVLDMTSATSVSAVLIAFSVSVSIGVIFGYFPANKAAKMNPIDALRHD